MTNYKKILRTGMLMSGLVLTGGLVVPAAAETRVNQDTSTDRDHRGFDNWGLLGLLGLAGLLGRKRERDVTHTGNVPHAGRV
ncbi:MAG TPA: WGxxGxxG-CTERM domain-containing protein [Gemmatimonadales bacterium]|jgi:MYXO-CTERM domain-containing protein|nr:WGxxGxxG-CTERM domain-containing protein [Gemmatimonadales bacterium]